MGPKLKNEIINSVQELSLEEKTQLVCGILDDSCLDPHQVCLCLGLDDEMVDKLENSNREFFESEYFHMLQLDNIPTKIIREYVNRFNIENQ